MASTPTNRLKLSASNPALFQAFTKSPARNRTHEPRLSLKRVIGTTCTTPTAFDTAGPCFAYVAGGAVVVVDLDGPEYTQRFYRARPTATPVFQVAPVSQSWPNPTTSSGSSSNSHTPKANDARNRVSRASREPLFASPSSHDPSLSQTWTSRERIKAATCVSLSADGRFLAVGETGYAPRVLLFSLADSSSDRPLVAISEHGFGVKAVAWSPCGKFLASLGTVNDGCLFIWKVDRRNGSSRLFLQSRCTSLIHGILWVGHHLITFGTRHVRAWKVVDEPQQQPSSPTKKKLSTDASMAPAQKTLPGRNVILGPLLDSSFTCGLALDDRNALLCSEGGDVCLLDNTSGQLKLTQVTVMDYGITCCARYGLVAVIGGKNGYIARLDVEGLLDCAINAVVTDEPGLVVLAAMGFVQDQLVSLDCNRSINVWEAETLPGESDEGAFITLPGQNDPVLGVQALAHAEESGLAFSTWSASGRILLWGLNGCVRESFEITVDDVFTGNNIEPLNQLCALRADDSGRIFAAGDKVGVLRVVDSATRELLLETKAHTSEITLIAARECASRAYIATAGRDRTVQLLHRPSTGYFDLLQTLEFPARVTHLILSGDGKIITSSMDRTVQIHQLVSKNGDPDTLAAIQCRTIALKASPTSMALSSNCNSLFVSNLDRSVFHFDVESGQRLSAFKCTDENGFDTAVLDSLVFGPAQQDEPPFLLALSNTDKSVRIYNASTGAFMDREWGHTESINGVVLVDGGPEIKNIVSVGCDGTIFIWDLNLRDPSGATSRSPSSLKGALLRSNRPPLRRVLSKSEIAEYPRPSSSHSGRRSPPTTLRPRKSRKNPAASVASARTPHDPISDYPGTLAEETPSCQPPASHRPGSSSSTNNTSALAEQLTPRPSMPALSGSSPAAHARRRTSAATLRAAAAAAHGAGAGAGSLEAASEQTCRRLRTYRDRLSAADADDADDHIGPETLAELAAELRLTGAAVAARASRTRLALTEPVVSGLLDRYSEKLVDMLDEKLRLRFGEQGSSGDRGTGSLGGVGGGMGL